MQWHWAECGWGALYLAGLWLCVWTMKKRFRRGIAGLCMLQIVIIQVTIVHFTPKVEAYSQRAAITFFQRFIGKDVYVHPLGYKSYAHLFYTRKQPGGSPGYYHTAVSDVGASAVIEPDEDWLLRGRVDKPVYFICKVTDASDWRALPQLEEIGNNAGFVFFRRR